MYTLQGTHLSSTSSRVSCLRRLYCTYILDEKHTALFFFALIVCAPPAISVLFQAQVFCAATSMYMTYLFIVPGYREQLLLFASNTSPV